jgi:hypothetical protein
MKKDSNYYTGFKNEYQDGKNLTCRVSLFIISVNAMKGRSNRFPVFRELLVLQLALLCGAVLPARIIGVSDDTYTHV